MAQWMTVSQATYVQHERHPHVNQASEHRAKELRDAFEKRSSSPAFIAKSNSELSYTAPAAPFVAKRAGPHQAHHASPFRQHISFETSTSRTSFHDPPMEILIAARHTALQTKQHHGHLIKSSPFTANSESRREYQAHSAGKPPRGTVEERPLRSKHCKFDASSTYQTSFAGK